VRREYAVDPNEIAQLRQFLESELVSIQITVEVHGLATHPEDDLILATEASARADHLVTGDRQLLALGSHAGALIVSPRQFLTVLQEPGEA
jgi:predicted nucleic acid-binding protein